MGYDVTIFEALRGQAVYWYTVFRNSVFPKRTLKKENRKRTVLGVKIETNVIVGKSVTIDDSMERGGILQYSSAPAQVFLNLWEFPVRMPTVYFLQTNI